MNARKPLYSIAEAAAILGVSVGALEWRIFKGEVDIVHTRERKRWVPARELTTLDGQSLAYEFESKTDLSRLELAHVLGWSYCSVSRAVARDFIPTTSAHRIPWTWVAALTSREAHERQLATPFDFSSRADMR